MAALYHQASAGKRPRADRRPARAPDRSRKLGGADGEALQFGERLSYRKSELCARPQARMRREAPVNGDARAVNSVPSACSAARQKPAREFFSTARVVPNDLDCPGATRGDEQRWPGRRCADSAKPAAERAAEIEQPEMETRRRLDEDGGIG
jgi:hypothetical protein